MGGTLNKHEAEKFVKWFLSTPKHNKIKRYILTNEGDFSGMVRSCLGYIWEEQDPNEGVRAYYRYLSSFYKTPADRGEIRLSELQSEEGGSPLEYLTDILWSTISGYSPEGDVGERGRAELVGSATAPALAELYYLQDEGVEPWKREFIRWVYKTMDESDRQVLLTWCETRSYEDTAEILGTDYQHVKDVYRRAYNKRWFMEKSKKWRVPALN